jgi:hypothetical protein
MYYNVALNKAAYKNKYAIANDYADKVKQLYQNDSLISLEYNQLNNGKWNHMMDQTHIGYTYWQQPNKQRMPQVNYVPKDSIITPPDPKLAPTNKRVMEISKIPSNIKGNVFYELGDVVSVEAAHFTKSVNTSEVKWRILPDLGRTGDGITTFPVTALAEEPVGNAPHLEYEFYTYSKGEFKLNAYFSPTLNFNSAPNGLQYAISVDDEKPQIISINGEDKNSISGIWNKWVADNIIIKTTTHNILKEGKHTIKYWMVNSGVVLQKLVVNFGEAQQSNLGPPETRKK